ncbi:MAG: alkaline phosphatase family protein [Verrucomicrobiota bacterium]|nr:alkaline phosphatase family protein [Verrucomicrobiota bacterium]
MSDSLLRFRDLPRPDYNGGSILNLMSSLIRSRGGRCHHRTLRGLPPSVLRRHKKVIVLLLDGLGANQLHLFLRSSPPLAFFNRHPWQIMTTVSPATTASVVTTVATGASPAEHAVLGWHLHLPDLGMDGTILPFSTRTGTPIAPADFDLERYLALPTPLATTQGKRVLISQAPLPSSRTSMAQSWWHERHAYQDLEGLLRRLKTFARKSVRNPAFAYAYWPFYDTLCHECGPDGQPAHRHLVDLDAFLARAEKALHGTDTLLLVTADHGHMRTENTIDLSAIPGFYDCLASLPSGDARMTQCFVRPAQRHAFLQLTRQPPLAGNSVCVAHSAILRSGLLGPGTLHPALRARLGDEVLFAAPGCSFQYPRAQAQNQKPLRGTHGGLSEDELRVPLFVIRP